MPRIHDRDARGQSRTGWLDSRHTFSFGQFMDPNRMGFGPLRVINDDRVIPGAGFPTHGHRDMEILTYVLSGALAHKDSLGNGSVIRPGEIQRMSAGTGITHSEMNASKTDPVHFLQIWVEPEKAGLPPSYEQTAINVEPGSADWTLIAGPRGGDGAVTLHQDVQMFAAKPSAGQSIDFPSQANRCGYIHIVEGQIALEGEILRSGDGLELAAGQSVLMTAQSEGHALYFDVPA